MARTVTATEAKAKLLALLDEVEEGEEIEITRHGHPVARLAPARKPKPPEGWLRGVAWTTDPDDDLIDSGLEWEMLED